MPIRTLSEADSAKFSKGFRDLFGVCCGGSDGASWGYTLWYKTPRTNSESWEAQIYSRGVAGTLSAKSGWRKVNFSAGNGLNVRVPMWNQAHTLRRWRGNCNKAPVALPAECDKTCVFVDPGVDTVIQQVTKVFVPDWVDSAKLTQYLDGVANSNIAIDKINQYVPSRLEEDIHPLYMNDLMENVKPFYYGKSTGRKRPSGLRM
jgi:hypothetical protein